MVPIWNAKTKGQQGTYVRVNTREAHSGVNPIAPENSADFVTRIRKNQAILHWPVATPTPSRTELAVTPLQPSPLM